MYLMFLPNKFYLVTFKFTDQVKKVYSLQQQCFISDYVQDVNILKIAVTFAVQKS